MPLTGYPLAGAVQIAYQVVGDGPPDLICVVVEACVVATVTVVGATDASPDEPHELGAPTNAKIPPAACAGAYEREVALWTPGCRDQYVVGAEGFEPPTPSL
jgi:hypothetical protein